MYEFLLQNVCDYLVSDTAHSSGGAAIWRKMLNSRRFDVEVFDNNKYLSRKRRAGKDWAQVYQQWHLIPWVTLKGKADRIVHGDDE
jgi:hypothetical protein